MGKLLWQKDFGSPVSAIYILDPEGLISTPFSSLSQETLSDLAVHFVTHDDPLHAQLPHLQLYPTLYIGEHVHGLYALPTFVDQNTVTITTSNSGLLLLEGPNFVADPTKQRAIPLPGSNIRLDAGVDSRTFQSIDKNFASFIILGYYAVPDYSHARLQISGKVADINYIDGNGIYSEGNNFVCFIVFDITSSYFRICRE